MTSKNSSNWRHKKHPLHYWKRFCLAIANIISDILPPTQFFKSRVFFYKIAGLEIGKNVKIVGGVKFLNYNISIGNNTWLSTGSKFQASADSWIFISDNVDIGPDVFISTGTHEIGNATRRAGKNVTNSITIDEGSWIGMRAVIIAGVHIGKGCIVAAGAVVTASCADNILIGGVPAFPIKNLITNSAINKPQ